MTSVFISFWKKCYRPKAYGVRLKDSDPLRLVPCALHRWTEANAF